MHIDIRGVHLNITKEVGEYFDRKIQKLDFAKDLIIDLLISVSKEKSSFKIESTINFRWGVQAHIHTEAFDIFECIDGFMDKLEKKVLKEKEKIQQH
jgi:putative sigma-54 modulation protein